MNYELSSVLNFLNHSPYLCHIDRDNTRILDFGLNLNLESKKWFQASGFTEKKTKKFNI